MSGVRKESSIHTALIGGPYFFSRIISSIVCISRHFDRSRNTHKNFRQELHLHFFRYSETAAKLKQEAVEKLRWAQLEAQFVPVNTVSEIHSSQQLFRERLVGKWCFHQRATTRFGDEILNEKATKQSSRTTFGCNVCQVPLSIKDDCFPMYHEKTTPPNALYRYFSPGGWFVGLGAGCYLVRCQKEAREMDRCPLPLMTEPLDQLDGCYMVC